MRTWIFGDDVSTDAMAPGQYMKYAIGEIAKHCFESSRPEFAREVKKGDVVVAGRNFGAGSSREQAPDALRELGVSYVLARSYGGIFYRNAFNVGLPVLVCPETAKLTAEDELRVDPEAGTVDVTNRGMKLACEPVPAHLMAMVRDGGLLGHLKKRFAAGSAQ